MNILDIIIIICFIPILITGYKKGFINQALSIIVLIAGVWTAYAFGDIAGEWFAPVMEGKCENPQAMANLAGFSATLVVACIILALVGKLIEKICHWVIPEFIDKVLGIAISAVNGLVLLCTLYLIFNILNKTYLFTDMKDAIFTDSLFLPIIESATNTILPNFLNMFV